MVFFSEVALRGESGGRSTRFAHHFGGVIKFVAIVEVVHEKLARDAE